MLVLLVAVGTALSLAMVPQPEKFKFAWARVLYEHRQPDRFGPCPLEVEMVIQADGHIKVSWAAMDHSIVGCHAITMWPPNRDGTPDKTRVSTMVASQKLRVTPSQASRALTRLYHLGWVPPKRRPGEVLLPRPDSCSPPTDAVPGLVVTVIPIDRFALLPSANPSQLSPERAPVCFEASEPLIREMRTILDELGLAIPADARLHPYWRKYVLQPMY